VKSVRIGRFLGVLACAAGTVTAVGCGTQHAGAGASQTVGLAAAVSRTQDQTARIATTISSEMQGMAVSFTTTGVFDFARSRGIVTIAGPLDVTELFVPPTTYIKVSTGVTGDGTALPLPKGKTWVEVPDGTPGASSILPLGDGGGDPGDLLAALTAMSSGVTRIGTATIRGVPVTGFAIKVDLAKAAGIPSADQAAVKALVATFGAAEIPVDVWVDGQNLVRREKLTAPFPVGSSAPTGASLTVTTDYYDFGVPVRVSAPPASQVVTGSQYALALGGASGSSGSGSSGPSGTVSPPPASGTLTPDQATSAEQAVAAFWAALGRNSIAAVAATVPPAQRSCVQASLGSGGPTFTVSSLHIMSARPAGNSGATVLFTVKAEASLSGQAVPVFPLEPDSAQWLATTEVSGRWYVNIDDSTAVALVFGGCA
jgi:hypothetical protein